MEQSSLATTMVIVLAALVLVQTVVIAVIVVLLSRRVTLLRREIGGYFGRVKQTLEGAEQVLVKAVEFQSELPVWEERVGRAMKAVVESSREIDGHAEKAVQVARTKVEAGADRSDQLLTHFSRASYRVHEAVLHPANRISAAISAVQATLSQLLPRSEGSMQPGNHPPDKQILL